MRRAAEVKALADGSRDDGVPRTARQWPPDWYPGFAPLPGRSAGGPQVTPNPGRRCPAPTAGEGPPPYGIEPLSRRRRKEAR